MNSAGSSEPTQASTALTRASASGRLKAMLLVERLEGNRRKCFPCREPGPILAKAAVRLLLSLRLPTPPARLDVAAAKKV